MAKSAQKSSVKDELLNNKSSDFYGTAPEYERRTNVRYQGTSSFLAHDLQYVPGTPQFQVLDFNVYGCRLKCLISDSTLYKEDSQHKIQFRIRKHGNDGNPYIGEPVLGTVRSVNKSTREFSFIFSRPLRLERIEPFEKFFVEPKTNNHSDRNRSYQQQEKIALSDLQELHAATRENVNRQFQLQLLATPAIGGLLVTGALFNFEQDIINNTTIPPLIAKALAILIPLFCSVLSLISFTIYTQKANRIRERTAFCALLQRYITMGAFPPCYRGWHDAQSNMRQFELRGSEEDVFVDPKPIKEKLGINPRVPFTKDPFTLAGTLAFGLLPVLSILLAGYGIFTHLGKFDIWKSLVAGTVIIGIISVFCIILWREIQVQKGKRSSRHIMVRYSELLKCVPPFDPHNTGPLRFTKRDHSEEVS